LGLWFCSWWWAYRLVGSISPLIEPLPSLLIWPILLFTIHHLIHFYIPVTETVGSKLKKLLQKQSMKAVYTCRIIIIFSKETFRSSHSGKNRLARARLFSCT
jgi:hypothetical protein